MVNSWHLEKESLERKDDMIKKISGWAEDFYYWFLV
jgi:hypothetical protein